MPALALAFYEAHAPERARVLQSTHVGWGGGGVKKAWRFIKIYAKLLA